MTMTFRKEKGKKLIVLWSMSIIVSRQIEKRKKEKKLVWVWKVSRDFIS